MFWKLFGIELSIKLKIIQFNLIYFLNEKLQINGLDKLIHLSIFIFPIYFIYLMKYN